MSVDKEEIRKALDSVPDDWSIDDRFPEMVKYCGGIYEVARASSFAIAHLIANTPTWLRSLLEENETLREEIKRAKWEDEQFTWLQDQVKTCAEENAQLRSILSQYKESSK